jgi:hypothetical protein
MEQRGFLAAFVVTACGTGARSKPLSVRHIQQDDGYPR